MSDYNDHPSAGGAYLGGGSTPYKAGSMASDSMANLNNDYDSVHDLNGSSIALEKYEDGGWNGSGHGPSKLGMGGAAGAADPYDARAAGLAKYGIAKNTSGKRRLGLLLELLFWWFVWLVLLLLWFTNSLSRRKVVVQSLVVEMILMRIWLLRVETVVK